MLLKIKNVFTFLHYTFCTFLFVIYFSITVFSSVNKTAFVFVIAGGVGIFIMIGLLRSVLNFSIKIVLLIAYVLLFVLAFCSQLNLLVLHLILEEQPQGQ